MTRAPHLPAAVITDQDAPVARVVPAGATTVKIGQATAGYWHKALRPDRKWSLERQRLSELERIIAHRHGGPCDTDDGSEYLYIALHHFIDEAFGPNEDRGRAVDWAERWTPREFEAHGLTGVIWSLRGVARASRGRGLRADTVARMLNVKAAERAALKLRTIGAIDLPKRQRMAARKARHRERQKEARHREGATPRAESAVRLKPWVADGFNSRRTWERHGKRPRDANSCASSTCEIRPRDVNSCAVIPRRGGGSTDPGHAPAKSPPELPVQEHLFGPRQAYGETARVLAGYTAGIVPPTIRDLVLDTKRALGARQEDIARRAGMSRPQLANALAGRFGLSAASAARLKAVVASVR